ncbi:MAG TPA: AraC family transcriptional regulator, partial [Pseudomonas sp.]|nr:AraC family transcriptional regulator [Pseudomonas sp.]
LQDGLGMIDRGASAYINGDHQCRIEAGTLVLMNPGDVHACNPIQNQPWAYRMLYVETRWLSELQDGLGMDGMDFRRFAPIMTRDPLLQAGFRRFHAVLIDDNADLLQKETGAVAFFSQLHERLGLDVEVPVSDLKLQRAAEYIADNYQRSLKLDEISLIAGVSPSSLIRAFKKHFGMTPHAYLTNRRVQFARAELRRGRPISDVALAAGFADQAHLQRAFKQLLAATPGHYRTGGQNVHHNIRQVSSK